jgi:hypothetical protein
MSHRDKVFGDAPSDYCAPPAANVGGRVYDRAESEPDGDSFFWVEAAADDDTLTVDQVDQIVEAIDQYHSQQGYGDEDSHGVGTWISLDPPRPLANTPQRAPHYAYLRRGLISRMSKLLEWTGDDNHGASARGDHLRLYYIAVSGEDWMAVLTADNKREGNAIARGWARTPNEAKQIAEEWEQAFQRYESVGKFAGGKGGSDVPPPKGGMSELLEWNEASGEGDNAELRASARGGGRLYRLLTQFDGMWKVSFSADDPNGGQIARGWARTENEAKQVAEEWEQAFLKYEQGGPIFRRQGRG